MSDLISRQAAEDVINAHRYVYENKYLNDYEQGWNDACDYAADEWLEDLPSADRPTGKWVFDDNGCFSCNVCHKKPHDQTRITDFCPNCGAKMEVNIGERKQDGDTDIGSMRICPHCGLDVHSDFDTCPRCGAYMRGDIE